MSTTKAFTIKLFLATLFTCVLCTSITMFSFIIHNNIETINGIPTPLAYFNSNADAGEEILPADMPLGAYEVSANESRNEAPDDMPAAIGQADGSVYVFQEEVTDEEGSTSYIYANNSDGVEFEDGGLGESELIISEE